MLIRTKILASHAMTAAVVVLIGVVMIAMLRVYEFNQRELQASYEQIRAVNLIAAWSNDYSEQMAELFILGTGTAEIEEARDALMAALDTKERLVNEELGFLVDPAARAGEEAEILRIGAMRNAVEGLDLMRETVAALLDEGRRGEAEALYRDQIEHRLDSVLGALIDAATTNERREVEEAIASSAELSARLRGLDLGLMALVAALGLANGLMLQRSISRPIAALAAGADAVGRGDLAHVVPPSSRDELGHLATRFNLMTAQIRHQRERLLRARDDLARQVDERTRELRARGEELEAANARLRDLDQSRAQFLADISHELRTPLTILRGQAEVTLRAPDAPPEALRAALALAVRKADQMGRLVEDLLFLARSEAGAVGVERQPVVLQDVVAEVLMDSQGLPRREGVTLSPRQPAEPVVVRGDADRLRQAVLIALDNALKVAPAGSAVAVELRAAGPGASILVRDRGPGFTPEEAGRAFARFFRGSPARGRSGRGAGLGLSIARWIVEQHGGAISIDSHPGEGATVRIDLPLLEAAA